jgi:hypothetical protein
LFHSLDEYSVLRRTAMAKSTKKPVSKKSTRQVSQRTRMEKELKDLLKKIDEEGLIFLLKQANIIVHNMQVDKLNKEIVEYERKKGKKTTSNKQQKYIKSTGSAMIEETGGGKSFIITLNGTRKIFSLPEMKKIVHICHAAGNRLHACRQLYNWFYRNRTDVFADGGISGAGDPALAMLYSTIVKTYTVKG